ncbi:MAG TPA: ATP-binding protein [Candidatus Acidoferrum sp.]|jgi:signal transduction histidine kinase/CheY-like chemotaxis protein
MGFWRKSANRAAIAQQPRGISHAALQGATLEELCQQAYSTLEPLVHGRAERVGIWLNDDSGADDSFTSHVWDNGRESDSVESSTSQQPAPFPQALLTGGVALEQELNSRSGAIRMDATAGMRRALWVPIGVGQDFRGAILAASRNASAKLPREEIELVAGEMALAADFRSESAIAQARAVDLAETHKIWSEISQAIPLHQILQDVTNSSLRLAGGSARSARFATLGILRHPGASELDFRWHAGDNFLARSATSEPISSIWRKALETRSTVGSRMPARWAHAEISRVVAVPLISFSDTQGVLVVGYQGSSATLAHLECLEIRASLASAAIAMSANQHSAQSAVDDAEFLMQNISDPVFLLNSRMEITKASAAAKHFLPPSATAISERLKLTGEERHLLPSVGQVFKSAELPRLSAWMNKVKESDGFASCGISMGLKSGQTVQVCAAPLPAGGFTLILKGTLAKEDLPALRATAELHSLIEWIDQGVLLFDENETLRATNQRFSQLFGLDTEDLQNATGMRALVSLIAPHVADPPQFAARWWDAARGVEPSLREEVHIVQPASRLVERISRPVLDPGGARLGRMEIYRDLTAQQSFQSKLHKSERLASLGEKLGSVAHELSNPLTTILGYAQRLLRHAGNSRHREDIERIFSEADRASSILRQLLGATRESSAERRPVELNPLVRRTVELLRFQLASEKIRLELDLSSSLPAVLCDGDQLHQILTNLISNARHAVLTKTPPGSVFVRTRAAVNGRVIVEVADSGPGIPEADQQRIFDPFFTTKPAGIGTGLGLSIVMGLVRQNHGNIRVRSAPGEGATFSIDLPAANTLPEVVMPVIAAALSSPLPSSKMGRVLVVEDEPTVAQLIADMLCDLGYSSDVLHDARRAMVSALNRDYALIICDMKMPGLDGQHFYRALAEAGCLLAVKFLFVTGDVLSLATREFLRKHRLPHIAKPFRLEEFAEKLAVVLAPAPPGTSLQPADLADDLAVKNLIPHG